METAKQPDTIGYILIVLLLIFLTIAGFIAYKSIDWTILNRLEETPLNIPAPITPSPVSSSSSQLKQ